MDVYILGAVCLLLCLWIVYLQFKIKTLVHIIIEIAEGKTVIEANRMTRTIRVTRKTEG
jgi:hypothetical protein